MVRARAMQIAILSFHSFQAPIVIFAFPFRPGGFELTTPIRDVGKHVRARTIFAIDSP